MTKTASTIPAGYHTVTPHLVIEGAAAAIAFYQRAFGATEKTRMVNAAGKIACAEILLGDSLISLSDEVVQWSSLGPLSLGGSPVAMTLYVEDVDEVVERAVAAGAKLVFPVEDRFYGRREGRVVDPYGHFWIISTHKEDVPPEELPGRLAEWMKRQGLA